MQNNYRQAYIDKEAECEDESYEFLGWENGWGVTPDVKQACRIAEHYKLEPRVTFDIQANDRGSANIRGCELCRWYSKYDCSD